MDIRGISVMDASGRRGLITNYVRPNSSLFSHPLGALRDRLMTAFLLAPNQCRPEEPFSFPRDLRDITRLDPLSAGRSDHPGTDSEL